MSTPKIKVDPHTLKKQGEASDPRRSAWVSANAGSGKTYVLTQRVVRLLLSGFDPSRILCLTFTRAAAAEMSNRVFENLSSWAVMAEEKLAKALQEMTGEKPATREIRQARRLFARALETPGGLKIQTIHAFCEALLHQFPLEANIAGHFETLDEKAKSDLITQAKRQVILAARSGKEEKLNRAFSQVLAAAGDQKIEQSFAAIIENRHELKGWFEQEGGVGGAMASLRQRFNVAPDDTVESVIERAFPGPVVSRQYLKAIADVGSRSDKVTDQKLADKIILALDEVRPGQKLNRFFDIWLTWDAKAKAHKARSYLRFAARPIKSSFDDLEEKLALEAQRLLELNNHINLLKQLEDSEALFVLAQAMIDRFEAMKTTRGLLDFDDLIVHTADLLGRSNARQWVQYKLDQGIDHVLVDEAQDTNPHQWQVITSLVDEFFSGKGARETERTVFAVGDEKQSIYSFQGAQPDAFADQRDRLKARAEKAGKPFSTIKLNLSFRSTPDVLLAVDRVFSVAENYNGLSRDRQATLHDSIRQTDPGVVEIWPLIAKEPIEEPEDWAMPVDQLAKNDPQVRLARKIAHRISDWLEHKTMLEGQGRPIKAGDVLVLVRSRDRFATALTRELKVRNVAVAGSDRLQLTDHIAVQDLLAIGRFIQLPEDDLSLAAILKSPLFGFNEGLLYQLAYGRGKNSLYHALCLLANTNQTADNAVKTIKILRKRADLLPVYEFYALLLGADGGRAKIIARLGPGVEEVLDAFLAQIHKHEQSSLPGMEGFIDWLQSSAPEVKREFDLEVDEVKIMTVHAAKGLEAPIVFLVDKGSAPYNGRYDPLLIELGSGSIEEESRSGFLWLADKKRAARISLERLSLVKAKAEEEYKRLLYVAMTRAADRLILCGTRGTNDANVESWHSVVMRALEDDCEEIIDENGDIDFYRWQQNEKSRPKEQSREKAGTHRKVTPLPDWIDRQLPAEPKLPRPLAPSGAQALIDAKGWQAQSPLSSGQEDPSTAMLRGVAIHRLLQTLPDIGIDEGRGARKAAAERYLAATNPSWSAHEVSKIIAQVNSIIDSPDFAHLFSHRKSRAEVAISGTIELTSGPRLVSGQIDRLIVEDDLVTIIDYKTMRPAPLVVGDIPQSYISQLALYRQLAGLVYPDRPVKAAILWTEIPRMDFIPQQHLDAAYLKIAQA